MTHHFRRLTLDDGHDYLALMLAAYAPIKALGIHFDAATADLARVTRHLTDHAVFALFDDQRMVASVTLRFPGRAARAVQPAAYRLVRYPSGVQRQESWRETAELAGTNCPAGELKRPPVRSAPRSAIRGCAILRPAGVRPDVYNRPRQRPHHAVYEKVLDETQHARWLEQHRQQEFDMPDLTIPGNISLWQPSCRIFATICIAIRSSPIRSFRPRRTSKPRWNSGRFASSTCR